MNAMIASQLLAIETDMGRKLDDCSKKYQILVIVLKHNIARAEPSNSSPVGLPNPLPSNTNMH